jgi:hypothetical protein
MMKLIIAGLVVAAGIAAYKLWKAGKAVTTDAVIAGVKTEVKDASDAAKPALMVLIKKLMAKLFFKS